FAGYSLVDGGARLLRDLFAGKHQRRSASRRGAETSGDRRRIGPRRLPAAAWLDAGTRARPRCDAGPRSSDGAGDWRAGFRSGLSRPSFESLPRCLMSRGLLIVLEGIDGTGKST